MACLSAKTSVRPLNTDLRGGADESSALSGFAARWVSCLLLLACPAAALAERDCPNAWHGAVVAVEGLVELDTRSGWMAAHSGKVVCDGDIVRTGAFGRATVRLPDGTLMQIGPHSAIRITATESGTSSWPEVVVKVLKGVIHVITRDPRPLRYDTPFVNAGIEGTEFVVRVRPDGAAVTVIEGEVALTNAAGQASAKAGTKGTATFGTGPEVADDPAPLATIDWMRRFPPVLEGPLPAPDAAPTGAEAPSAVFYVRRAASRLAVGAAEEADGDLAAALAIDPDLGEALALQALLVLSNGERGRALELAEAAVEAAPNVSAGWLALSHAASAALDRTLARESAETATRVAPAHAYAWARLAELRFAAEDYSGARSAAAQAARLDPRLAAGHVVLGFAHLAGDSAAQAEAAFRAAIGVDAANPYSHLGLGLALYRQGEKDAARAEIEVAVGLDPTNPIIRSYAARVYDEENRDELAATVLDIAKALDAEDSTGLFYDALRKQHENRPGDALLDFRQAWERSGRQSVYAAQISLDEDLPARSAGLGRLHSVLGFEQLGIVAATRTMLNDPSDHSAHRLLADLYPHRPRHQLARVHEVHQAIMLQPLNVTPFQPQLADAHPFLLARVGPSPIAFQEFHPLIRENGQRVQLSGVTASNATRGIDVALNGLHDRVSYNVGLLDYETDGFRPNNGLEERVLTALMQARPRESTTITAEVRSSDIEEGDLALRFDPNLFFPLLRRREDVDSVLLGVRQRTPKATWLGTVISEDVDGELSGFGDVSQTGSRRGNSVDLQNIREVGAWTITAGARHLRQEHVERLTAPSSPVQEGLPDRYDIRHSSLYAYGNVALSPSLRATLGANLEEVETYWGAHRRAGPKLGVMWDVSPRTSIRAAVMRKLQSPFVSKHNIQPSLEPTHVMGFNQHFFGSEGEDTWRYGVAVDHEFAQNLFGGIELSKRDVDVQFRVVTPEGASNATVSADEQSHLMYLYWLPTPSLSFAASYEYEEYDGNGAILPTGFGAVRTHRVPLRVGYAHPSGFTASIEMSFVDQAGTFTAFSDDPVPPSRVSDRFVSTDVSLGYRLPSKRGQVTLKVLNAADTEFRFQDIDPENPRILPARMVQMAFTLSY